MTENLRDALCNSPLALIIHERKKRKLHRKLGVSTEQLQTPPPRNIPPSPDRTTASQAKIDFEIARHQFHLALPGLTQKQQETEQTTEPEEIEVSTTFNVDGLNHPVQVESPMENMFFRLPSSQQITTDEQLYEEFKGHYNAQGIENAFLFRRRNQRRDHGPGNRQHSQMIRRRK